MTAGLAGGALCLLVLAVLSPLFLPPMSEPHRSLEKKIFCGGTKHLGSRCLSQGVLTKTKGFHSR